MQGEEERERRGVGIVQEGIDVPHQEAQERYDALLSSAYPPPPPPPNHPFSCSITPLPPSSPSLCHISPPPLQPPHSQEWCKMLKLYVPRGPRGTHTQPRWRILFAAFSIPEILCTCCRLSKCLRCSIPLLAPATSGENSSTPPPTHTSTPPPPTHAAHSRTKESGGCYEWVWWSSVTVI